MLGRFFVGLLMLVAVSGVTYPTLPEYYEASWLMLTTASTLVPPYVNYVPPGNYSFGRTYYNWKIKSMVEIYYDTCIAIFPFGNNFSCTFINTNMEAYFVWENQCCLFGKPFHPPEPNFLQSVNAIANGTTYVTGQFPIEWFSLFDIPSPPGPFSYGFVKGGGFGHGVGRPAGFSFPVIGGSTLQLFLGVNLVEPPASIFDIPAICNNAGSCPGNPLSAEN